MPKAGPTLNILAGVTAAGKTNLCPRMGSQNNAEIISCDAVSVYKGMDIGSAKPTIKERSGFLTMVLTYSRSMKLLMCSNITRLPVKKSKKFSSVENQY